MRICPDQLVRLARGRRPVVRSSRALVRLAVAFGLSVGVGLTMPIDARAETTEDLSDAALAQSLPGGFESEYARVNGTGLHYVAGGEGAPLVLLPGWPQTWWQFHKLMPALAERHRVIAVDLRGMGGSDKPAGGYDKKTMARDIYELIRHLGYDRVNIAGHDIGAMVAYSFAANHPQATGKIVLLDVAHPDESLYELTLLPPPREAYGDSTPPNFLWWFAFNQVRDLPQQLLAGRERTLVDWLMAYMLKNPDAVGDRDRAVYARAYSDPDAIRAGNGWYQAFGQDIIDQKAYGKVAAPILVLAGEDNYPYLRDLMPDKGTDVRVVEVKNSGHYVPEEQPEIVARSLIEFFN
jgi:pimeloyl-ACP methyl ester carboxylesterase